MNRSRILTSLGFAALLAAVVPACVFSAQGRVRTHGTVTVTEAPPPPQEEVIEVRSGYVFVRGHWDWQGRWVWIAGHWERERAGYMWAEGRWEQRGNQWVWVEGEWRTGGAHGTVVVNDPGPNRVDRPDVRDHRTGGGGVSGGAGGGATVDRPEVRDHRTGGGGATTTVVVDNSRPRQPPPAPRNENPGAKAGYIWVTGHWDWRAGNWEWIPGHWERQRAKHRWRDGRWELQGNVYVWVEGGWDPEQGGVEVRDHRH